MERLKNIPESEKEANTLKINVVRHDKTSYRQPEWRDIKTAHDLESTETVEASAESIANEIGPDEEVIIWASPTGRTLEAARIISETLEKRGIKLRKKGIAKEYGINIFDKIGEVKNFKWKYFEPLFSGGQVEIAGKTFFVDKEKTNPDNLSYFDYFNSDAIEKIPAEVKNEWPEEYINEIDSFERFKDITKRSKEILQKLLSLHDKNYRIIIVTHDAVAGSIINIYSPEARASLNPGNFMSLERKGDDLVVTHLGSPE